MASAYDKASLVMLPHAYKDDKLYSVKPEDRSGDFTFSRDGAGASPATRVNASGLIEKGRENVLLQSNTFSSGTWSKVNVSVTGGQSGYDGSSDAWLVEGTGSSVFSYLLQSDTTASVKTRSVYAKAGSVSYLGIWGAGSNLGYFDLSNGSLGSISGTYAITHSITNVGGGWYRCEFTTTGAASNIYLVPSSTANGTILSTGDNIYIQDAQLEEGLVATDYIETTTAAVSAGLLGDMPRLDYSGGATCPSLLLEPSRVNLFPYSEYFGADWILPNATITSNAATSPEGVDNASLYTATNVANSMTDVITAANGTYTLSVFVKRIATDEFRMNFSDGVTGEIRYVFNLLDETSTLTKSGGTISNFSADFENYGNGWYRLHITATTNSGTAITSYFEADNQTGSYYIYGAQLESGSYPTSYIPTYGSASTRGADDIVKVFASPISQNGGTFFIELKGTPAGTGSSTPFLQFNHSNPSSYTSFGATSVWRCRINDNGTARLVNSPIAHTEDVKLCIRYGDFGYEYYANGSSFSTYGTAIDLGDLESITYVESSEFYGNIEIKQMLTFPTALTDAECIALTTI